MAGSLWNTVKGFGSKVAMNSTASNYVGRAVKWGAIGAAAGGAMEWAGGGSFFEGAKSGAFTGAVAGAGYTAYKAGRMGTPGFTTPGGVSSAADFSRTSRETAHAQAVAWRQKKAAARGAGGTTYGAGVMSLAQNQSRKNFTKGTFGLGGV